MSRMERTAIFFTFLSLAGMMTPLKVNFYYYYNNLNLNASIATTPTLPHPISYHDA